MELIGLSIVVLTLWVVLVWRINVRKKNRPVETVDPEREMAIRNSLLRQRTESPRGLEYMNVNQNQYLGPGL